MKKKYPSIESKTGIRYSRFKNCWKRKNYGKDKKFSWFFFYISKKSADTEKILPIMQPWKNKRNGKWLHWKKSRLTSH